MYSLEGLKVPTNPVEAEEMLRYFHKNFNGGFHPEDDGHQIVNADGPVFSYLDAELYNKINEALWQQLGQHYWEILSIIMEEHG